MTHAKQTSYAIDRKDVIAYIKNKIEQSPSKEFEVSTTDLAREFGIQGPSMDYHLKKFLEEGVFTTLSKKGKYGRKIYTLPKYKKEIEKKTIINDMDAFAELIKSKIDAEGILNGAQTVVDTGNTATESPVEEQKTEDNPLETVEQQVDNVSEESQDDFPDIPLNLEPVETKEFTLNDRIEKFIKDSKSIPDATQLISKPDKEILSVMAESIQQQQVYLKDLSNQLELMENLTLLHNLIDERNKMIEEMDQIRKEHNSLLASISKNENQVSVDPQRVRIMHQIIINTLDTYLELPNHSLALQRKEFRNNISKEISDLANYILGIEK